MRLHFEAHGVSSKLELDPGTWTLGGAPDDGIRFPGLPSRLLELELRDDRVWVTCTAPRPVGRAVLAPGVRRWLLPGERVRLSRLAQLLLERPGEDPDTLRLLRSLLRGEGAEKDSAAARLSCVAGVDAGVTFPLLGATLELGRLPSCEVQLGDGAVSRRHLQLTAERGAHRIRDLGGRNRARCNGRWLRSGKLLCDGDVLAVGRSLLCYRGERRCVAPPLTSSGTGQPVPPAAPSAAGAG
jgi:hypothetical protein